MLGNNSGIKDDILPLKDEEEEDSLIGFSKDGPIEHSEASAVGKDHLYYRDLLEKGYTDAEAQRHTLTYLSLIHI